MPTVSAADLVKLRTTIHATALFLNVYKPATIWTAQVDGTQTAGDTSITVKSVSQTRAPQRHYQVLFGTTAGARDLGETRWKSYGASTLNVGAHNSALPDNAYITVKEEIKPRAVHVAISATDVVSEDGDVAYTNENTQYLPLARIGCPAVEFRDPVTGIATVNFWSNPTAIAAGATISSHAWDFKDGNPASSVLQGTALVPIAVQFNSATPRYITYTTTDSNGKTHTRYIPVFTPDLWGAGAPYSQVEVSSLEGSADASGWRVALRVLGDADTTEFPNQALIVLSARDYYGADLGSIGGQWRYRENIVFTGYIVGGTVKKQAATGAVEFEAEGIGTLAGRLPGLAATLETNAAPTGWHQLLGMNYNLAAHHILTQHSTLSQIADVNLGLLTYLDDALDLPESSLREQLGPALAAAVRGQFGSSAQGMIYLQSDPQLLAVASRPSTIVLSTQLADFRDEIDFGDEQQGKPVSRIDLSANLANDTPVFSLAPPYAWEEGQMQKVEGLRADTQNDGNDIAGIVEGKENNSFNSVVLNWRGNYRVFDPFPAEPIQVSIAANQNLRGLAWTNQKCWPYRVSYEYRRSGILLANAVVSKDSVPSSGVTGEYPTELPTIPDPIVPIVEPAIELPTAPAIEFPGGSEAGEFRAAVYLATSEQGIFYTTDFTGPGGAMPTWVRVNGGLPILQVKKLTADPVLPSAHQYCLLEESVFSGGGGHYIYYRPGSGNWVSVLDRTQAAALLGVLAADIAFSDIATDVHLAGKLGVIVHHVSGNMYYVYTLDYGATWAAGNSGNAIGGAVNGSVFHFHHGLFKGGSAYAAGQVVYAAIGSEGVFSSTAIARSLDGGTTWTSFNVAEMTDWENDVMQIDVFQDVIYGLNISNDTLYRSLDRGATWTAMGPAGFDWSTGSPYNRHARDYRVQPVYDPNGTEPVSVMRLTDTNNAIYKTVNAGVAWVSYAAGLGTTDIVLGILAFGDAASKLYGINIHAGAAAGKKHVWVSTDEGITWEDKSGADTSNGTVNGIPENANGCAGILPIYA